MKSFRKCFAYKLTLCAVGILVFSTPAFALSLVPCLHLEKDTLKEFGKRFDFVAAVEFKSKNRTYQLLTRKDGWKSLENYQDLSGGILDEYSTRVIEYYKWKGINPPNDIKITVSSYSFLRSDLRGVRLVGGHYTESGLVLERAIAKEARDILKGSVVRVDACNIQDYDEKSAALAGQIEKF